MDSMKNEHAWRKFSAGKWQLEIDVRGFIVANVTPYLDGPEFLEKPTNRTQAVWKALQPYFNEEVKKGVLDVDTDTPASVTAHAPGYIDKANEIIVGLQTNKPFKRAIMQIGRAHV